MAGEADIADVKVELEPGEAVQPNGAAAPGGDTAQPLSTTVDEGVDDLRKKLDDAERRAAEAERRAGEATRRATAATGDAHASQMAVLEGAIQTLDANKATFEAQYEEALGAGDFKKAAAINTQLAENAAQRLEVSRGKAALERQRVLPTDTNDIVERFAAQLQPRSAAWIRAHPQYVTDDKLNAQMMAAHWDAVGKGIVEGTDAYFDAVNTRLGLTAAPARPNGAVSVEASAALTQPTAAAPLSAAAAPAASREVQPSPAPASRGGATRTVRLTREQQEAARISGLTNEEYARNLVAEEARKKAAATTH